MTDGLIINFDIYNLARMILIKIVKETVLDSEHKSPPRWNLNINVLKTTIHYARSASRILDEILEFSIYLPWESKAKIDPSHEFSCSIYGDLLPWK